MTFMYKRTRIRMLTLENRFHQTAARFYAVKAPIPDVYEINKNQVKRIREELCGIKGCKCGGFCNETAGQVLSVEGRGDGGAWIIEH